MSAEEITPEKQAIIDEYHKSKEKKISYQSGQPLGKVARPPHGTRIQKGAILTIAGVRYKCIYTDAIKGLYQLQYVETLPR